MKDMIKSVIGYTALIGIPMIFGGAICSTITEIAYKDGYKDGEDAVNKAVDRIVEEYNKE